MSEQINRDRLDRLAEKAAGYEQKFSNCAQGTLLALQEEFGVGSGETVKAATVMPGLALRGDICGAVTGALMAIGLALGSETAGDQAGYLRALVPARRFCRGFENEFGSLACRCVQQKLFGRSYDMAKPDELAQFVSSGHSSHCHNVAGTAARLAGALIIDNTEKK